MIVLAWRGKGTRVFGYFMLGAAASFVLGYLVTGRLPKDQPEWVGALAFVLAGTWCWRYGRLLRSQAAVNGKDQTAERHHFFFIPIDYWGIGFVLIGVGNLVMHGLH
ncbi:MAG TPA: hypothetical protein VGM77_02080 [Gemmatimonadales bacterium]